MLKATRAQSHEATHDGPEQRALPLRSVPDQPGPPRRPPRLREQKQRSVGSCPVMATTTSELQRPPSLREVLDAGLGLELFVGDWVERLAELVYFTLPSTPPLERAEEAARARAQGTIPPPKALRGRRRRRERQERAIYWQWAADLYETPELAERVKKALPSEMVTDFEAIADLHRRPYRLDVRTLPSWWRCHNCGAAFDEGEEEALVVLADSSNDLSEDITYCFDCIRSMIPPRLSDTLGRC